MRAGFGLVGILICIGVLVWFLGPGGYLQHQKTVIDVGEKAKTQVSQIAGIDHATGAPARDSATIALETTSGRTDSILVTSIVVGGAYEKFWGLQRKDSIIEMGPLPVRGLVTSKDDAEAYLMDAYQRQQQLLVVRNGQKITLPIATPGAKPAKPEDALQSQLESLQKSGR